MEICPKCGRAVDKLDALSRTDNKTMVCFLCGIQEALENFPGCTEDLKADVMKTCEEAEKKWRN